MSNFLKKGKRIKARADKKELKHRTKDFYKILGELDMVAKKIFIDYEGSLDSEVTEENIVEIAADYTDREIAAMEKFILLGKLEQLGFKGLRNEA